MCLRHRILVSFLLVTLVVALFMPPLARAGRNEAYISRGIQRTLFSTVEIPRTMIEHSKRMIFPVGLLTGAIAGTFRTLVGTAAGAADIARGAAPYAKYLVFFV